MLRAILVGAPPPLASELGSSLERSGQFALLRSVEAFPPPDQLARTLRAYAPETVFVFADDLSPALAAAASIEEAVPGLPVVAFGSHLEPGTLLELMKAGIREYLPRPFEPHAVEELGHRIRQQLARNPNSFRLTDLVFSFLPAKAGVGASTIATNLAAALARQPGKRVLLADFDLSSGLIAFMLKVTSPYSVLDAAEMSAELDDGLWQNFVAQKGNLEILPTGRHDPQARIQPIQIQRLLTFARRLYHVICVDLSGNLEKYAIELMHESKRTFLITTPEIPPLHLARERLQFLRQLDLGDRVAVVVNRYHRASALKLQQIEDVLEAPVFAAIGNSYHSIHRALVEGRPVEESSDLGRQITELARRVLAPQGSSTSEPKRFIEYFGILHPKFSLRQH